MSNANNNLLQNMGMQMPMFAAANQQAANDDVDLHDIFADYFNEENNANEQLQLNNAFAAQQAQLQQQQHHQQQMSLPTGQGIKTAWHSGSLPAMQQGGGGLSSGMSGGEPEVKRSRGEDLFLPSDVGGQQSQMINQQSYGGQSMGGTGGNNNVLAQQQMALAQAVSGVGTLSSRLGFNLPTQVDNGTARGMNSDMMGQQQYHQQQQQQGNFPMQQQMATQQQSGQGGINLPIGSGMKFGANGNIMPQASIQAGGDFANGNADGGIANGGIMANNVSNAMRIAVSNMQYGVTASNATLSSVGGVHAALQIMDRGRVEDQMAAERRLRNREHAKRSRVRKKFMLESLQQQVRGLQGENSTLRMLVQKHIPQEALKIIDDCCSKSVLFATGDGSKSEGDVPQDQGKEIPLLRSDFSLIESLTSGQQNFVLSDPRLPDNPIVFASPGFYELTGYTREQVLGRNCRFLQGAGTDREAIDVIRTAVANGTDATVCLLNYRSDGTPFWNQLFVAALRDADNCIVNYVGVQTMIEPNAGASALEDKVNAAHPMTVGVDDDDNNKDDANE